MSTGDREAMVKTTTRHRAKKEKEPAAAR